MWFGIILFGMANGFLLLPVVLSFIGPTESFNDPSHSDEEEGSTIEMAESNLVNES